jgi:tricorn protease
MWGPDNKIYFISDRDDRMNPLLDRSTSKETKQLTNFKDYDIKFPSIGKDAIVFEQAGYIWRCDPRGGQATPIPIQVKEDFASAAPLVDAAKHDAGRQLGAGWRAYHRGCAGELFSVPARWNAAQPVEDLQRS